MVNNTTLNTPTVIALALRYPTQESMETIRTAVDGFPKGSAERDMRRFVKSVDGMALRDLEELFTRTFDINPQCTLELGWQLYGEDYNRGAFLVRMRELMREKGVEEGEP